MVAMSLGVLWEILRVPKNFIADTVSTKVGLIHIMLFIDGKKGALEISGPKICYFRATEKFNVTWVMIDRS